MRPIHLTDLDLAARVLLGCDSEDRASAACRIVAGARLADLYRKRMRQCHQVWGDGTLVGAALAVGVPVPPHRCDGAYRHAMVTLLCALDQHGSFDLCQTVLYWQRSGTVEGYGHGQHTGKIAQRRSRLEPDR